MTKLYYVRCFNTTTHKYNTDTVNAILMAFVTWTGLTTHLSLFYPARVPHDNLLA